MPIDPRIEEMNADSDEFHRKWITGYIYGDADRITQELAARHPHPLDSSKYQIPTHIASVWGPFFPKKQTGTNPVALSDGDVIDAPVFARKRNLLLQLRTDSVFCVSVHSHDGVRFLKTLNEANWADVHLDVSLDTMSLRFPEHFVGNIVPYIAG